MISETNAAYNYFVKVMVYQAKRARQTMYEVSAKCYFESDGEYY